jgi:hypothetical protein
MFSCIIHRQIRCDKVFLYNTYFGRNLANEERLIDTPNYLKRQRFKGNKSFKKNKLIRTVKSAVLFFPPIS